MESYEQFLSKKRGVRPWAAKLHPKEKRTKMRLRPRGSYPGD